MFDKAKWAQFHNYSGVSIKGTIPFNLPVFATHWERVIWLTSVVESGGKFGTVMSYDGTGMTAGLSQTIGVYPKELADEDGNPEDDQGSLWRQVERIGKAEPEAIVQLQESLKGSGKNWSLANNRVVGPDYKTLNGRIIREELTPNQGRVPRKGPQWEKAKTWALIFNDLFSNPNTFETQIAFSIDHSKEIAKRKSPVLQKAISEVIYGGDVDKTNHFSRDTPLDLAMAVFFSNSVNAPAAAYRRFTQALDAHKASRGHSLDITSALEKEQFAARLIRVLGTAKFARWNAEIPGGRYQRTRDTAFQAWPQEFFLGPNAIMPKRF